MVLLFTAAALGAVLFGGLGIWADDLVLSLLVTFFGASLFAALAALLIQVRQTQRME
jgi:hypothetical protein